eukprot:15260235-Ditylum_brightwellii.AAC.1
MDSMHCYKEGGNHGDLGGKHWWFRPGHIARSMDKTQWKLKGNWPAAGIQDQSWVAIKYKNLCVDTNANPRRFWAK